RGSPASLFPTSLRLIGRRHGNRGYDHDEEKTRLPAGGPPAKLLSNWEDRRRPTQRRCPVRPGPACRFDEPAAGTEEFLGRRAARPDSWRAQAKGALADPLYVFGAAGSADGNRNDRTSRCRPGQTRNSTRYNRYHRTKKIRSAHRARS